MFYLDIFTALANHEVRYLLIGGLAMNLHGVPRMTMDVDLVIALDTANLQRMLNAAASLDLQPVLPLSLEDILDPEKRNHWIRDRNMVAFALRSPRLEGPTVDILIDPPLDVARALSRAELQDLGGTKASLASIEDMIALKEKSGRKQDLADIEHLRRLQEERKRK
mgnify:CR=1 FL=1